MLVPFFFGYTPCVFASDGLRTFLLLSESRVVGVYQSRSEDSEVRGPFDHTKTLPFSSILKKFANGEEISNIPKQLPLRSLCVRNRLHRIRKYFPQTNS